MYNNNNSNYNQSTVNNMQNAYDKSIFEKELDSTSNRNDDSKSKKKKIIIIISIIVILLIVGVIVLIVCLRKKRVMEIKMIR